MRELSSRYTEVTRWAALFFAIGMVLAWGAAPRGPGFTTATVLALVFAARNLGLTRVWFQDGSLELNRSAQHLVLPMCDVLAVERRFSVFGERIRIHFLGPTPIGRYADVWLRPAARLGGLHADLFELRDELWLAQREAGATRVLAHHRMKREGPRRGTQGRRSLGTLLANARQQMGQSGYGVG
jgi:hypothetical protein